MAASNGPRKMKVTYATLLCNDSYFNGVLVLVKTIRKYCSADIPITVLVDQKQVSLATRKRLAALCDHVITVDTLVAIPSPTPTKSLADKDADAQQEKSHAVPLDAPSSSSSPPWAASEMTKLRLWELTQFDQVVYIDADCMVLDCLDELFERCADLDFAAAPDVFPPDRFNAGVLYLRPSAETFKQLCAQLPVLTSYDGGDTGFLNAFFPHWYCGPPASRLPFGYNMQRTLYWFTYGKRPGYWDSVRPKKIVHFSSSPKPWETSMASCRGDLEFLWWQTLMGM